jgi:hypothetical protein
LDPKDVGFEEKPEFPKVNPVVGVGFWLKVRFDPGVKG